MHTLIWCMFSLVLTLYFWRPVCERLCFSCPVQTPMSFPITPPRLGLNEGGSLAGDHGCTWSHGTHLVHVSLTVEGILCLLHHLFIMCFCTTLNCFYFFGVLNVNWNHNRICSQRHRKAIVKFEQIENQND